MLRHSDKRSIAYIIVGNEFKIFNIHTKLDQDLTKSFLLDQNKKVVASYDESDLTHIAHKDQAAHLDELVYFEQRSGMSIFEFWRELMN